MIFAPNSALWNSALRNHTRSPGRLICLAVTLPDAADSKSVLAILAAMLNQDRRISKIPPPMVFVESRSATNGTVLTCSFRVAPEEFSDVQRTIIEDTQSHLGTAGIEGSVAQ